jgi:disulfide bond formation protein DsbB
MRTHDVIVALAVLGVVGQILVIVLVAAALLDVARVPEPIARIRGAVWGYELWSAFAVSAVAVAGSLYFSEVAHFVPCKLCWFQRIFMYPIPFVALLAALWSDHRAARYVLPLPVVGAYFSVKQLLIERGVIDEAQSCFVSAPGGCATRWVDEFGYVTIPALALTGFALVFAFLLFAAFERKERHV